MRKAQNDSPEVKRDAYLLLQYFISKLKTVPRLDSWFSRNMRHCKDLLKAYSLEECKIIVDTIFQDSFWHDKVDDFGPIIKTPHKWLPIGQEALEKQQHNIDKKILFEIEQHIWYTLFNGDPLDNTGRPTEECIKEALERYKKGDSLENIYKDIQKLVRK